MAAARIDRNRVAQILVDAESTGNDRKAAERHGIAEKTLYNYKRRLGTDPELAEIYRRLSFQAERSWHLSRARFLRRGIEQQGDLLAKLTERLLAQLDKNPTHDVAPELLDAVTKLLDTSSKAFDRVGNLDVALEALGVGSTGPRGSRSPPPEDEGGDDAGAGEEPDPADEAGGGS